MLPSLTYFCCVFAMAHAGARIMNGSDAEEGEFPFAVSLRLCSNHKCGGSILNDKFILTAAHCIYVNKTSLQDVPFLFSIQYGLLTITKEPVNSVQVKKINMLPYNPMTATNDVAVLELVTSIPAGNWKPVNIAKTFSTEKKQKGIIIGWGQLYENGPFPENLQKLNNIDIYDDETCSRSKHHICLGRVIGGACLGDSGSALIVDGIQVGIASFITDECGVANEEHPNVYTRVSTYYDWIKNISEQF